MNGFLNVTSADMAAIAPEAILSGVAALLVLLDAFARPIRKAIPSLAILGLAAAFWAGGAPSGRYFAGALELSELTRFVELLTFTGTLLALLWGTALLVRDGRDQGEFFGLLLWSAAGLLLMVKAGDMLVFFIGLELMSFALYVLAAWYRDIPAAGEAGMKYFLVGALASTFLLFGVATLYGRLGTTSLARLAEVSSEGALDPMVTVGILAVVAALGFKLALVPFHSWAPDVYQGMTTPAVAFLSTAPKAAAMVVLVRFLHAMAPTGLGDPWKPLLALLAVLSILFGNIVALAQRDTKRMLAYSGIAQMGYAAIALATFTDDAFEALLVFLAGYLVTNAAAFLSLAALSVGEKEPHSLLDLAGTGRQQPLAASVLTLSMISLAGVPPTVGFLGKLLVFKAAVDADLVWLTIVGVFGSIVSVGYYLRVVYTVWMKEPTRAEVDAPDDAFSGAGYVLAAAGMLLLGVFPGWLLDRARDAAKALPLVLPH